MLTASKLGGQKLLLKNSVVKTIGLCFLLVCILLPTSAFAMEKSYCKVYDKGSGITDLTKEEFESMLVNKVDYLNQNNSQGFLVNYIFDYSLEYVVKQEQVDKKEQKVVVDEKFASENTAKEYFDKVVVEENSSKVLDSITLVDDLKCEEISDTISCNSVKCVSEIENLENTLKDNQTLSYDVNYNQVEGSYILEVDYKIDNEIKYFDTQQEALSFMNTYVPNNVLGYKFVNNKITTVLFEIPTTKTYLELMGNDTFDTLEQANNKLAEFQKEYNTTNGSVVKVKDATEDIKESDTLEFDTETAMNEWISNNNISQDLGSLTYSYKLDTIVDGNKESINLEFDSYADLENYIKDLEDNSYILENKEINEIKSGITGEVITGSSYDSNSRYEFSKNDTNFILLKQGSGAYAIWSENALSDIEKETFVRTYNEVNSGSTKFDGSTTNITIDQITWINGYDTFDLSIIGKNWGSYTFSTDNNSIIITCDKSKLSHLVKGFAKEKVKYQLTGLKYKQKEVYLLTYNKVLYGFDYKIEASVMINEKVNKYKVVSIFKKLVDTYTLDYSINTYIEDKYYKLSYNLITYIYEDVNYANWQIIRCEYPYGNGNSDDQVDNNNSYLMPPKTGNDDISIIYSLVLLFTLFGVYKVIKD